MNFVRSQPPAIKFLLLPVVAAALVWSAIAPHDYATWFFELFIGLIGVAVLVATARWFRFSTLVYAVVAAHFVILAVGAKYTYAEVPAGFWVRDALGLTRNPYDRLGHFAQGFVPAILAREILLRTSPLRPGKWLFFLVISVCLAFSAFYELIEWITAVTKGEAAEAFLGTQGDVWDTQKDMACALVGAILAQLTLSRIHDGQLEVFRRV